MEVKNDVQLHNIVVRMINSIVNLEMCARKKKMRDEINVFVWSSAYVALTNLCNVITIVRDLLSAEYCDWQRFLIR